MSDPTDKYHGHPLNAAPAEDVLPEEDVAMKGRDAELFIGARRVDDRMQTLVDALWAKLRERQVSWLGFYIDQPGEPDDRRMVLGPHRDSPACSPIGLHGVCGKSLLTGQAVIVRDVRDLGEKYIACDPRDRSELVIPLRSEQRVWGVLDIDSHAPGRFTLADWRAAADALLASGFEIDPREPITI